MKTLLKTLFIGLFILQTSHAIADLDGETITYFLTDHLGSPVLAMDEEGELLWKRDYSAFGEAQDQENSVPVGHTGHEFVPESGLSYMGARWYHPELGRFLQPDPVGFVPSNSLSFNRYLYVNNNPYMHEDPDGEFLDLIVEVASIAIGVTSAIQNFSQGNIKEGLYDVAFVVVDAALMPVPIIPGGSGAARHALKNSENVADAASSAARACSFAEGTLVATPSGMAPIESLTIGDQILARSESGEEMDYKRVSDAYSHEHTDGMTLTVSHWDGTTETLTTTQEHPFYVEEIGFVPAGELVTGQQVATADGMPVTIDTVDLTPIQLIAYNYTVEDFSTYFVGESRLWVHNACNTVIESKIRKQMGERGWNENSIQDVIQNPSRTAGTRDTRWNQDGTRRDDPATAYVRDDGHYVVRNDNDGTIVQVSDTNNPNWESPFE
ncbi:colicin E5-related ribonuclease [Saccharospirillum impatiens]|uniref:colicin E5-related ribonuclease n=1 Tax=Saccharospirillum impatiens TaxID=169438 RepID=UPI00040DD50A|nr:colicin E5-related ribonuclease [Saccharospirillum impatiens]